MITQPELSGNPGRAPWAVHWARFRPISDPAPSDPPSW